MKRYIDYVLKNSKKPLDFDTLCEKVQECIHSENGDYTLTVNDKIEIERVLEEQVDDLVYYKSPFGKYCLLSKTSFRKGRFYGNRSGDGFVISTISYIDKDGKQVVKEEKYGLTKENCGNAVDGDYVLVDIGSNGQKPRIERVVDRTLGDITGIITRLGNSYFLTPFDKKKKGLTIALEGTHIEGEIVSVSITEQRDNNFYIGVVKEVFRHKDDPNEAVMLEAFKSGMPQGFSEASIKQLDFIPDEVSEEDKIGRYDFTDWEILSIDGADTKDKDDCISLKKLPNGNVLLGVHIADPPAYVPTNSPLHKDAFRKGTSYYYAGCVEPQYPRKISNGICSLHDGVERLCKSILLEYDKEGHVVSRSYVKSVINSRSGMTYKNVNNLLKEGIVADGYEPFDDTLKDMHVLAKKLLRERIASGAIEFNRPEVYFVHDDKGKPIGVNKRVQDVAESMIEEFMLAAGVNVYEILTEAGIPCPYRVHGVPDIDRLGEFLRLLNRVGYPFPYSAKEICEDKTLFRMLANHVEKTGDLQMMLTTNLIKTLPHAFYSAINIGHYAAGFDIYGHFTSPIRRLADDTVSRISDDCYFETDPEKKRKAIQEWKAILPEYCVQASKMEKVEEDVEKSVRLYETAEYLENFVGQEFEGTVVTIGNNGLTVQLDNLLEGRIRGGSLPGHYVYNADTFTYLSTEGKPSYYIGDRLLIKLDKVNKTNKTVDFSVIRKIKENKIRDVEDSNQKVMKKSIYDRNKRALRK